MIATFLLFSLLRLWKRLQHYRKTIKKWDEVDLVLRLLSWKHRGNCWQMDLLPRIRIPKTLLLFNERGTHDSCLLEGRGTLSEDVLVSHVHISAAWAGLTAPVKVIRRCQAALSLSSELASSLTTGSPWRRRALF